MLKRIMYVGDNHISNNQPSKRLDNYMESCFAETQEILDKSEDYKCDAVVFAGDIFSELNVSQECLNKICNIFTFSSNGKKRSISKFVTVGNHDIKHNMHYLPVSSLGILINSGIVEYTDYSDEFRIGFAHFSADIEERIKHGLLTQKDPIFWSVHGTISTEPTFGKYILYNDFAVNKECKMILAGHLHSPMEKTRKDGVIFLNPGSVGRNSYASEHLNRDVKVVIIDYNLNTGHIQNYEYIKIESALPSNEIFDVETLEQEKVNKKQIQDYVRQVNKPILLTKNISNNILSDIKNAGLVKQISEDVVSLVISEIEIAQKAKKGK